MHPPSIIKDTLKAFNNFKNKQKTVSNNVFWYVYSENTFNTPYIRIKHVC